MIKDDAESFKRITKTLMSRISNIQRTRFGIVMEISFNTKERSNLREETIVMDSIETKKLSQRDMAITILENKSHLNYLLFIFLWHRKFSERY